MFDQTANQVQQENLHSSISRLEDVTRLFESAVFGDGPRTEEAGANPISSNKFTAAKERINRTVDKLYKLASVVQDA